MAADWWWLRLISLLEKECNNCVWTSFVFSYLASHSEWHLMIVCVVYSFACNEKLKNIHVDLALLVWGPTLLSTHAPLPPYTLDCYLCPTVTKFICFLFVYHTLLIQLPPSHYLYMYLYKVKFNTAAISCFLRYWGFGLRGAYICERK